MIRFIDLGKQIATDESDPEYPRQFAWFDTVSDTFLVFDGYQVFDSWQDFFDEYQHTSQNFKTCFPITRFKSLCHEWAFK